MEICETCYHEDSRKHPGHEIGRLAAIRVTNMPDDKNFQANSWWRCSSPGCNTGASLFLITQPAKGNSPGAFSPAKAKKSPALASSGSTFTLKHASVLATP